MAFHSNFPSSQKAAGVAAAWSEADVRVLDPGQHSFGMNSGDTAWRQCLKRPLLVSAAVEASTQ